MSIPCEVFLTIPIVLKRYRITSKHFVRRINATNTSFLRLPVVFAKLDCFNKCYCGSSIWPLRLVKKFEKKSFLSDVYKIMKSWKNNSFRILKKAIWLFLPITELLWIGEALPIHLFLCKKLSLFFKILAGGDQWKDVAEKLGLSPNEIRFLERRTLNPCDAALAFLSQRSYLNVGCLYDVLTDCGLPVIADLLWGDVINLPRLSLIRHFKSILPS